MSDRFTRSSLCHNIQQIILLFLACTFFSSLTLAYESGYYGFQTPNQIPGNPQSIVMRATQVDVPAGAVFSLYLMKGQQVQATSRTIFSAAYKNLSIFTGTAIATFRPLGTTEAPGDNFPGAKLYTGTANLSDVAASPDSYSFFWELSDGYLAPKDKLLATAAANFSFIDLKLNGIAAAARQSDQKPGSVLFYPRYTSGFTRQGNNTTLSLTNTSLVESTQVRLFFISSADCQPFEQAICLAPQQSASFIMSELDPGTTGYCVAVACDADGKPTQFNWLIGNAQIRQTSALNNQPYDFSLSALAATKRTTGAVAVADSKGTMIFNDEMYDRLPSQLAADNIQNQGTSGASANATSLVVVRPLSDLSGGASSTRIDVTAINSTPTATTASATVNCYGELRLSNVRFPVALNTLLPPGRNGWVRISASDSGALIGAQFNSGSYSGGAMLRALIYANEFRMLVPIRTPTC